MTSTRWNGSNSAVRTSPRERFATAAFATATTGTGAGAGKTSASTLLVEEHEVTIRHAANPASANIEAFAITAPFCTTLPPFRKFLQHTVQPRKCGIPSGRYVIEGVVCSILEAPPASLHWSRGLSAMAQP